MTDTGLKDSRSSERSTYDHPKISLEFTETMRGYLSTVVIDDYHRAAERAEADKSSCEFTLTVKTDDLDGMIADARHSANLSGTVTIPAIHSQPLTVLRGTFNLFVREPEYVNCRLMRYGMLLGREDGTTVYFRGFKIAHDDPGPDIWVDTTTLYITISTSEEPQSQVLGRGILRIFPADFLHQLTTIRVSNVSSEFDRIKAEARFGRFFAGALFEVYGGVFSTPTVFNPDEPLRKKRSLNVCAPIVHYFNTVDGVQLRLTRYIGGNKGPVILSHGLGVSGRIFAIDTIETNLVEYLFNNGFDIWILDYRASIELPSAQSQFTADDVAIKDYPAAVDQVLALSGAPSVQIVGHCYGALTFCMAMCAGLKGVRSAVCSQIGTHIVAPTANRLRTGLHLPEFLDKLGVKSLSAYVDTHSDWRDRLYDRALGLYPVGEACADAVCRRITFMYAPLYRHSQLNEATHGVLHEMFGIANIEAFEGLAAMTRSGHIVDSKGENSYLPGLANLSIPISFIHGAENECFLPKSTELTYDLLRQTNGDMYRRSLIEGYGHIDCIFGKDAIRDVFPIILEHLEATQS